MTWWDEEARLRIKQSPYWEPHWGESTRPLGVCERGNNCNRPRLRDVPWCKKHQPKPRAVRAA